MRTIHGVIIAIAAVVAICTMTIPAEATSDTCITTDSTLLSTVEAKIVRHGTETDRTDLHEMFTKSYNTMKGDDTYTTSDIKARPDKQGSNWQGPGPNDIWRAVYAELDRLEQCRADLQADTTPPLIIRTGDATVTINKGDSYTDAGATCVDDTDGVISPVSSGIVDTTISGSYTISYSCTDTAGNAAGMVTRSVIVQNTPDTQPATPQTPSDNLVQNGSFEAPTVSNWSHIISGTDGLEWSVSGGPIEIQRGILGGASDGAQHAELDSTGSVTISQSISTTSGQSYLVSFDYKARPDTTQSTNGIQVQWNDIDIASGITFSDTWQTHTVMVNGTGSDTLSFMDMGTSDGLGTFLDNVSVVASDVPLFTAQSIQPGTPNIISFTVVGPTSTVNEGDVANFTISTTPAPTTPLDVTIRVSSPTGHVDTTNHTISIPTSGSAVLSVQTIDTPIDQPGTLQVSILDTATYLVGGVGGVTITIDDPGSDNYHDPGHPASIVISGPSTVVKGQNYTITVTNTNMPSLIVPNMYSPGKNMATPTHYVLDDRPLAQSVAPPNSITIITSHADFTAGVHTFRVAYSNTTFDTIATSNTISVEITQMLTGPETLPDGHHSGADPGNRNLHGDSTKAGSGDNTAANDVYNMGFNINYDGLPANWSQGIHNTDVTFQIQKSDNTWVDIPKDAVLLMSGRNVLEFNPNSNRPSLFGYGVGMTPTYAVMHPSEVVRTYIHWQAMSSHFQTLNKPTLTGKLFTGGIHDEFDVGANTIRVAFTYGATTIYSNEVSFTLADAKPVIKLHGPAKLSIADGTSGTWSDTLGAICLDDFDADKAASSDLGGSLNRAQTTPQTITYSCTDSAGNAADTVTRTVIGGPKISPWVERVAYGSTDRGFGGALDEVTVNAGEQPHWVSIICANENGNRGPLAPDQSKRIYKWSAQIVSSNVDLNTPTHNADRTGIPGKSAYYQMFACIEKDGTWGESRNRTVNVLPPLDPYDHTDPRYQIKIGASQTQIKSGQSLDITILSGTNSDWKRERFEIRNVDVNQGFYAIDNPRGLGCGSINSWSVLSTIPLHLEAGNYEIRVIGDHGGNRSCGDGKVFAHSNSVKFTITP